MLDLADIQVHGALVTAFEFAPLKRVRFTLLTYRRSQGPKSIVEFSLLFAKVAKVELDFELRKGITLLVVDDRDLELSAMPNVRDTAYAFETTRLKGYRLGFTSGYVELICESATALVEAECPAS